MSDPATSYSSLTTRFASFIILSVMPDDTISSKFRELLTSLFNAGWEVYKPKKSRTKATANDEIRAAAIEHIILQRTCLVLGVAYNLRADELRFTPVVNKLSEAKHNGIDLFDAVTKTSVIKPSSHGLIPFIVEGVAARLGLLDPARFTSSDHRQMSDGDFLRGLYAQVIAQDTAAWLDITQTRARQRIDDDAAALEAVRTALYQAPDVLPDPVPIAASIGITLDCWRHSEIEQLHASNKRLNDVVMAKLNISTTKKVRSYITTNGIDWPSVAGLLLDPERSAPGGENISDLVSPHWSALTASIEKKLEHWQHVESIIGPRATLRLLSVMGSTDYTMRWWGNSWWETIASNVFDHVEKRFPQLLPEPVHEFSRIDLKSDVIYQPDKVPVEVLAVLIDPPDGKGLRYASVPRMKVQVLELSGS